MVITTEDLKKCNVPPLFFDANRQSIRKRGVPSTMQNEYRLVGKFMDTIHENIKEGLGLLIQGPVGTTKTTLAVAVLQEALENGYTGYFLSMNGLLRFLNSQKDQNKQEFARLQKRLTSCDLLILDDFGAEYLNAWDTDHVEFIICERYNHKKSIIFTTNLMDADLIEKYDLRITDRIKATTGNPILLIGDSMRIKK